MNDKLTDLIHHPYQPPAGFEALMPAIHKASTVIFKDVASARARDWRSRAAYTYGLHGTPTTFTLEERIATLEGGSHCVLAPSGLAAITLVNLALLKQGDDVLVPSNAYGPSRDQARSLLSGWGIAHRLYDPLDVGAFAALIGPRTRLVWLEAPGSVTMEFPDLRALVRAVRQAGYATICALDNTWGAGLAFQGFELGDEVGVDIVMQALTKYPSGGGDVLMGSVVTRDEALHHRLLHAHMLTGVGVAANDAELLLRSLPTIRVRYEAQDRAARQLARWLAAQPQVARVLHPALDGSPGHAHWATHCNAAAGLFSVVFDAALPGERVDAFIDALKLFRIGWSWAGPVSLVAPYRLDALRREVPADAGALVRFSIGLEAVEDLQADLAAALHIAFG